MARRTDALLRALREELEHRREHENLDGDPGLRSITLVVNFDAKTGAPREILFRKESRAGIRQPMITLRQEVHEHKV